MAESFVRRLEAAARRVPDKPALVWDGGALTFAELELKAGAFSEALATAGAKPGDRIALAIGNHWTFAVALLAVWKLGRLLAKVERQRGGSKARAAPLKELLEKLGLAPSTAYARITLSAFSRCGARSL